MHCTSIYLKYTKINLHNIQCICMFFKFSQYFEEKKIQLHLKIIPLKYLIFFIYMCYLLTFMKTITFKDLLHVFERKQNKRNPEDLDLRKTCILKVFEVVFIYILLFIKLKL